MAFNFKCVKIVAIFLVVLASIMIVIGIANAATYKNRYVARLNSKSRLIRGGSAITDREIAPKMGLGIWVGAWILATGIIGIITAGRRSQSLIYTLMGFSIVSAVLSSVAIIIYAVVLDEWYGHSLYILGTWYSGCDLYALAARIFKDPKWESDCHSGMAMNILLIICALLELGFSIWSAVLCCKGQACCTDCCVEPSQQTAGHVTVAAQGPAVMYNHPVPQTQPAGSYVTSPTGSVIMVPQQPGVSYMQGAPPAYNPQQTGGQYPQQLQQPYENKAFHS